MKRALLIVLDSVGIGHAPDADQFGDSGANTVGHIREVVPKFSVPTLDSAGLAAAEKLAAGKAIPEGAFSLSPGCLIEQSAGKDTTTGHWEMAGAPVTEAFATFDRFPDALVEEMESAAGVHFLGNYAQSGTVILGELGDEHVATGRPILYTSADSVIQIAAHEKVIPVPQLYEICRRCRTIADRERIGRVIARPFLGTSGNYVRTGNRHDFSMPPPETILNRLSGNGVRTIGVGKISDIFNGSGVDESFPTKSNAQGCSEMDRLLSEGRDSPHLIFTNLVDFDMLYGHRRNPEGYAGALEEFDGWLASLIPRLDEETLLLITADHGNDPTWSGTDHTREKVPLLASLPSGSRWIGERNTFSDIATTLGEWFQVDTTGLAGNSFLTA
ncbi:MAG: phosphopentomutase [Verrucomicrobiales bacterium]|nr:phosphopentomutase [Verrucomicrobiales bacterium]